MSDSLQQGRERWGQREREGQRERRRETEWWPAAYDRRERQKEERRGCDSVEHILQRRIPWDVGTGYWHRILLSRARTLAGGESASPAGKSDRQTVAEPN